MPAKAAVGVGYKLEGSRVEVLKAALKPTFGNVLYVHLNGHDNAKHAYQQGQKQTFGTFCQIFAVISDAQRKVSTHARYKK